MYIHGLSEATSDAQAESSPSSLKGAAPEEKSRPTQGSAHEGNYLNTIFSNDCIGRHEAARRYAGAGIPIFPLGEKRPRIPSDPVKAFQQGWKIAGHGFHDATTDLKTIDEWFQVDPYINIGMPTGPASGWIIIDLDSDEARRNLIGMGELANPMIARTKRGYQLYYRWTVACEGILNSAGKIGPKIDVRSTGGYVALAPSLRRCGFRYSFEHVPQLPSPLPDWLVLLLKPAPKPMRLRQEQRLRDTDTGSGIITYQGQCALRAAYIAIASAPCGQQDPTLFGWSRFIGDRIAEGKIEAGVAEAMLIAAGMRMASYDDSDPWNYDDIQDKVQRGLGVRA